MKTCLRTPVAALGFTALAASAQTKWDMPTPYPAANFHTENITQFAADVDKGGALQAVVLPSRAWLSVDANLRVTVER